MRKVGYISAAVGLSYGAYKFDDVVLCGTITRSARALGTACYIAFLYKFMYSDQNSTEIHTKVARAIVDCCKANEGLYVKFGQALSTFDFVLPPEFTAALTELHDHTRTFNTDSVRKIIRSEGLGDIVEHVSEPIASGSIAQVHRARLKGSGEYVAVKVQKPNIAVQMKWDLRVEKMILYGLEALFGLPLLFAHKFLKEQLIKEVDFKLEGCNSETSRLQLFAPETPRNIRDRCIVPRVHFATKHVLVTEWIEGAIGVHELESQLKMKLNVQEVAGDVASLAAFQIFKTGHVHCDPHPGNLLVRRHPDAVLKTDNIWGSVRNVIRLDPYVPHQVVILDHGTYVALSPELRKQYATFWTAVASGDALVLEQICTLWGIRDVELFRSLATMDTTLSSVLEDIVHNKHKTAAKHRISQLFDSTQQFPRELIYVGKCLNYIRSSNPGLSSNRMAIFMEYALSIDPVDLKPIYKLSFDAPRLSAWLTDCHSAFYRFKAKLLLTWLRISSL